MSSVQINEEMLNRLRNFVASEYEGKVWGKISEHIEIAIRDYLDIKEGCHKIIITNKSDKRFYKLNFNGLRKEAIMMLSPIEGTNQRIVIPAEKGYWINLILKGSNGKEISGNPLLSLRKETYTEGRDNPDYYKYKELKSETTLKHKIHLKPFEKLVIYAEEDIGKVQDIEFEFAVDLGEK
ncbi:Uncharacterised protein [uncultured archaeon]|nr:Uncharacterised protein [uncultured archaeon]